MEDSAGYIHSILQSRLSPMLEKEKVALTLKLTGDPKEWDLGQPERQRKELDPVQIQTCHIMVTHFLDQLIEQGEAALVQKFK